MEEKSLNKLIPTQKGQKTNQPYPEVSPYPTMLPTHGELLSPINPGLSDHAWNLSRMLWGVVECKFMGETNYLRRCDFFKWELKILNHFCKKTATNRKDWNFTVRFFIHNFGEIWSILKNLMSYKNWKISSFRWHKSRLSSYFHLETTADQS